MREFGGSTKLARMISEKGQAADGGLEILKAKTAAVCAVSRAKPAGI